MTPSRRTFATVRLVTIVVLLLCFSAGLFFSIRAGQKLWWVIGAAALALPGCALAGEMLLTLVELRGRRNLPDQRTIAKLSKLLRWAAVFSFLLLGWMALSLLGQQSLHPVSNWIVIVGVMVTFPTALLLAANAADQAASKRPATGNSR